MARDYSKGKIYCIKVNTEEEYLPYVGSTTKRYLSQRIEKHHYGYKQWKKNGKGFISSFTLFEKFGIENCYIELIELFPCKCNDELRKKEREHIEKMECCNKVKRVIITEEENKEYFKIYRDEHKEQIAENAKIYQQTHKEQIAEKKKIHYEANKESFAEKAKIYRDEHKEQIAEKKKEYQQKNKEQIAEKKKEYQQKNKEKFAEKKKEYQQKNKEQIAEKKKEPFTCGCGSVCRKSDKARHEKSKKHQEYLAELTICVTTIA